MQKSGSKPLYYGFGPLYFFSGCQREDRMIKYIYGKSNIDWCTNVHKPFF